MNTSSFRSSILGAVALCLLVACGSSSKKKPADGLGGDGGSGAMGAGAAGGSGANGGTGPTGGAAGSGGTTGGAGGTTGGTGGAGATSGSGGADAGPGGSVDAGSQETALTFLLPDAGGPTLDVDDCLRFSDSSFELLAAAELVSQSEVYLTVSGTWYLSIVSVALDNYFVEFWRADGADASMLVIYDDTANPAQYVPIPGTFASGSDFVQTFYFNTATGVAGAFAPDAGSTGTPFTATLGAHDGGDGVVVVGGQGSRACTVTYRSP
jgi:hypothetical protein